MPSRRTSAGIIVMFTLRIFPILLKFTLLLLLLLTFCILKSDLLYFRNTLLLLLLSHMISFHILLARYSLLAISRWRHRCHGCKRARGGAVHTLPGDCQGVITYFSGFASGYK